MSFVGTKISSQFIGPNGIPSPEPPKVPYGRAQTITFAGSLTDGTNWVTHSFFALAGKGAPTVIDGGPNIGVVPRPKRVGVTVVEGYNPLVLSIPLLFDQMANDTVDGQSIEGDMDILEWMWGRGRLYSGSPFSPALGDPPLVTIISADNSGNPIPLVRLAYQPISWLVTGLAWDPNPDLNAAGHRIRQPVTVTATQHEPGPFDAGNDSPATRAKGRNGQAGKTYTVTVRAGLRTYQEIATHSAHNPSAARTILDANKTTKGLTSIRSTTARLPDRAKIKVPLSVKK